MVIGIIGESCTGKSSIAEVLSKRMKATVYAGKDYLKLAKNETEAKKRFIELLSSDEAVNGVFIYIISEKEHLPLLPAGALRVLLTADIDVIKERFAKRLGGNMPAAVTEMLERQHGLFDCEPSDLKIHNDGSSIGETCDKIVKMCSNPLNHLV
jgi:cytidylate kinase